MLEAQTLSASAWWDHMDGASDIADRLFTVLTATPNNNPEVLSIVLAVMFRQATTGQIDDAFFHHGYQIQRALAEKGELQAAQLFCYALLALHPEPPDALRFTLSLGTTLFRLRDLHLSSAMYAKARHLWGSHSNRVNLGRAFHGLGACELELQHVAESIVLTQSACDLYQDETPNLYYLALQNLALAYRLDHRHDQVLSYLEQCARYWADCGKSDRLHEIELLLKTSR